MNNRPIRTAMRELRTHEDAVKPRQDTPQDTKHHKCQSQPASTNSGAIECTRTKKGGC